MFSDGPEWLPLGQIDPRMLKEARLQAHWAVQVIAPVGSQLVPPQADYGHTALAWREAPGVLATKLVEGERPFRAGLRVADLTVVLLDAEERVIDALPLTGRTLEAGLQWLGGRIGDLTGAAPDLKLVGYTMTSHAVKDGAPFSARPEALEALERWYRNAAKMLGMVAAAMPDASELRVWPHHFDVATLVPLDGPEVDPEAARSVGYGMSPGDETYPEPYWYVLPWPPPAADALGPLAIGRWHTDGFVAAVLTGAHEEHVVGQFFTAAGRQAMGVLSS